ncbi:putative porin [Pseudomonas aeruginosa]|nr:putative porin [Pseudomonas aeruginosa]
MRWSGQAEAEAQQAQQARQAVAPAAAVAAVPGEVRVPYIPQVVRDQIRDEVKAEVMTRPGGELGAAQRLPGLSLAHQLRRRRALALRVALLRQRQQQPDHRLRRTQRRRSL